MLVKIHGYRLSKCQSGLTLIELVLVMVVMSLISVPIGNYLSGSVKAFSSSKDSINGLNELRYSMTRISQEIRDVDHDGSQYQIATPGTDMTDTTFTFINTSTNNISLHYDGGQLTISDSSVGVSAFTLANQVTAFDFNYYQQDGITPAVDGSDLIFVEFELSLQENGVSFQARSRVALRDKN